MSADALSMLKRLGGAAPALLAPAAGAAAKASGAAGDFASLLRRAADGDVSSGLSVTVSPRADLKLTDEQLKRLGEAADRAEAQGMATAVALIDGMAVMLDVQTRMITGVVDPSRPAAMRFDGVVQAAPGPDAPAPQPDVGFGGLLGIVGAPVRALLAQLKTDKAASAASAAAAAKNS